MKKISLILLTLPLCTIASLTSIGTLLAQQVTPDGTVSTTVTTPDGKNFNINDGTIRGGNLFHSFKEFSVPTGGSANFNNAANVQNIIGRVTGGSVSSIDGLIRTLNPANLFLLNPAGIIFGPNASLNIGGSFLGSTANSFLFDNGFEFSATNPQAPPLLTINIPIGLGFRNNPGKITNQSNQPTIVDNSGNPIGLTVPSGNSLVLVGGDINSDNGRITVPGGRVELGGLAGAGTVGLDVSGNTFKLNFPGDSLLSNITLDNDARVAVRGNGGGDIVVNANNFSATNGGRLVAGTEGVGNAGDITVNVNNFNISGVGISKTESGVYNQTLAGASGNAGNIFINSKSFNASSGAVVRNQVLAGSQGDGGNINITTGSLSLTDDAELSASTYGFGNAGNVSVQATDSVELVNANIFSNVERGGIGNGGNIDIKAANLSLKDSAQLQTIVRGESETQLAGRGDAGDVTVDVTGNVTITGVKGESRSAIFSSVGTGATGNGGNIKIFSGEFFLSDGAQLTASTRGQGNAGNVSVQALGAVELAGSDTTIFSNVEREGVGNGGNINIKAATFSLKDGAQLQTLVRGASDTQPAGRGDAGNVTVDVTGNVTIAGVGGKSGNPSKIVSELGTGAIGNGGNINIFSGSFSLSDGAVLEASTSGQGNAGNVSVQALGAVELAGSDTTIFSNVEREAVGKGGNIDIKAATFSLKDGAQLQTLVRGASDTQLAGRGNAGNVTVDVTGNVTIAGSKDGSRSGIFSSVGTGATGNGGNIKISSGEFSLSDDARLIASTSGKGDAGNVSVRASGAVELVNADIFSNVEAGGDGKGGNIDIKAATLSLKDGAQLQTLVRGASDGQQGGRGNAGNVTVDVTGNVTIAGVKDGFFSRISSRVQRGATGRGGNIAISSKSFSLTDGAQLDASTLGLGDAGNVSVRASDLVFLAGSNTGIFSTVESTGKGNGGNINIIAPRVSLNDRAQITASSAGDGAAGNIEVIARSIRLDNDSIIEANTIGGQGNITLRARDYVLLRRNSKITTDASGLAPGGNITINTGNLVAFPQEDSDITANAQQNSGGQIKINAAGIFGIQYRPVKTEFSDITAISELGPQFNGLVEINTSLTDPSQGLFELSQAVVDPAQQIAQNVCIKGFGSSFTITGRGGIPTDPKKILSGDNVRVDLVQPVASTVSSTSTTQKEASQEPTVKKIIPAQGWIFNEKGEVLLVGYDPTKTGPQRRQPAPGSRRRYSEAVTRGKIA